MKTQTISSVGALVEAVATRVSSEQKVLWFRGQRKASWDVNAGIWREYAKADERNFTNRFRSRAYARLHTPPTYDDCAAWLSLMQHHGLPTRLLDWTRSPLIAAYFALEPHIRGSGAQPDDASIWVLLPHELNNAEGLGRVTPSIDAHKCERMLMPAFAHGHPENGKVLAVMAAERDTRMFVQQGCFTIHSNQVPINRRRQAGTYLSRWVIPADCVRRMAFEVDICGIRRGDLFPDLGNLAQELKEMYPPTRP